MAKRSSVSSARGKLTTMSSGTIRNRKWGDDERHALRSASRSQASRRALPAEEYAGIPRLTSDQLAHMTRLRDRRRKVAVSVRLNPDVLDWLRAKGEGHLTRINDILTNLMEAERRTG
jgi:uncharacterized protein (DUF4415 family)